MKDIPVMQYADIVNQENKAYPFVNKGEKVPIVDKHVNYVPM